MMGSIARGGTGKDKDLRERRVGWGRSDSVGGPLGR